MHASARSAAAVYCHSDVYGTIAIENRLGFDLTYTSQDRCRAMLT